MTTIDPHVDAGTAQRHAAIARAHAVNARFVAWKLEVAECDRGTGLAEVADVLQQSPAWVTPFGLHRILRAVRGVGDVKARSLLRRCRIDERARVRDVTDRKRRALIDELRACAATAVVSVSAVPTREHR